MEQTRIEKMLENMVVIDPIEFLPIELDKGFDIDLGIAMTEGLHGYDPYNNIGRLVINEVIGI